MDFDLLSCTFENLNSMKFNELQKLSARFHVTKRWAKKRELIDKILLLRDQKIENYQAPANAEKTDILTENIKWVDGGKAFVTEGVDINQGFEMDDNNRRLTYCINKSDPDNMERRLTYKIEKPGNLICNDTDVNFDRRLTYNADDIKNQNMDLKTVASLNYEIIKEKDIHQSQDNLRTDNSELSEKLKYESKFISSHAQSNESKVSASSKVKKLTVPYSSISSHNNARINMKDLKCNTAKLTENSYKKKSIDILSENVKSSEILLQEDSSKAMKDSDMLKSSGEERNVSKISVRSSVSCGKNAKDDIIKQNKRSVLPRRKSRTEDNVLVKNFKSSNLKFYSPKESEMKKLRSFSKPSSALNLELTCRSRIPKAKSEVSTQKSIVATKMPDFSKIHQRRFEKMDSLIDYKRKKEERAKKLFGLPQPGIPIKVTRNDVFQFKSSNNEKENKLCNTNDFLKKDIQNNCKGGKEKLNRKDVLSRAGSKPDIMMSLKEQNRKHLHGVRTNKRFELLMKSRKL